MMCLLVADQSHANGAPVVEYDYMNSGYDQWVLEKAETANFSCALTSTPIHPDRAAAWATSEADYNRWPATSKSRYYGKNDYERNAELIDVKNVAIAQAGAARLAGFENGGRMLLHYLYKEETPYKIDFKDFNNNWDYARNNRKTDINEVLVAAEEMALHNQTITFARKSEKQYNAKDNLPMSDYKLAVNSYSTHTTCSVTKTSNTTYRATIYYYLEDIYDWNPTKTENTGLISQQDLWELHHAGGAKAYKVYGMNKLTVTWTKGQRYDTGAIITDVE